MAGMLFVLTLLAAAYLVFKGIEIFQVAFCSSRLDRGAAIILGIAAIAVSVLLAVGAVMLQAEQLAALNNLGTAF